jgi:putative copper resistance protein D
MTSDAAAAVAAGPASEPGHAETPPNLRRTPVNVPGLLVVGLAITVAATGLGLVIGGGAYTAPVPGITDAGPLVGWLLPVARSLTLAFGVASFGWLFYAAFLGTQQPGGLLGSSARADVRRAGTAAGLWAIAAAVAALLSLANVLGSPLAEAIRPTILRTYAWDIPSVRAYVLASLFAGAIWVAARYARSLAAAAGWWVVALAAMAFAPLAGHAAGYGDHALALTSGVAHVWATAAWFGGLLALAVHAWRADPGSAQAAVRYRNVALVAVAALALTGIGNAYTRMDTISDLWNSGYGRLVLIKSIILLVLIAIAAILRQRLTADVVGNRRSISGLITLELSLLAVAAGLAVALAQTPYPRAENSALTVVQQLLGRDMPDAPDAASLILGWQFEPVFLVGGVVAAALYIAGVVRLRGRGDSWPVGRTISWLLGVVSIMWATNSGLAIYSPVSFSIHMLQHMMLSMIAPILLVMGTPITLALRAIPSAPRGRRGPREWIVWGINSPLARFVTHPIWVLLVFTVGLYGLYYTPLFGWLMGSHLGHLAMQIHFLLAGYLFSYVILGLDPAPRTLPPWLRMLMLLVAMALHSFFAVPIMMSDIVFAGEWYSQVQPPWISSLVTETRTAGGIAWAIAEVPAMMLMIVLGVQWARSSEREARRYDRQAARDDNAELAAYNERLKAMHEAAAKRGE